MGIDNRDVALLDDQLPIEDPSAMQIDLSEDETQKKLVSIFQKIEKQERPTREIQVRLWKYMELLWHGIQYSFWNAKAGQWTSVNSIAPVTWDELPESIQVDPDLFNKIINVIRPYGESIAGALTTSLPKVKYFPEDADKPDDIQTAQAYSKIEKIIANQNYIKIKLIKAVVLLWNQGMAAIYNYTHADKRYGIVKKDIISKRNLITISQMCPMCGGLLDQQQTYEEVDIGEETTKSEEETLEKPLEIEDQAPVLPPESSGPGLGQETFCQTCNSMVMPEPDIQSSPEMYKSGEEEIAKSHEMLEVYGPMNVKIPVHASTLEEVGWLILEQELHEAQVRALYPDKWDEIRGGDSSADGSYERWARSQYENSGEILSHYTTLRRIWLRPWAYGLLEDKELAEGLRDKYPKGIYFVLANEIYLEGCEEDLDEHWTLSINPLYNRINADPIGKAMIPIQEMINELIQLEIQTVKYAIPQTFADPEFLDFQAYRESESAPGMIYPMKGSPTGRPMSDVFFETRTASLPKEVGDLNARLEKFSFFVTGAFPSVFGGPASGSKTLGEYQESRNQALQRLHIILEILHNLYADTMAKAVKSFAENLLEDEKLVEAKGDSFVNVWIRRSELTGKVGRVMSETSDQFPISWSEKRSYLMELIQLNNEALSSILMHPENIGLIAQLIGLDDLYVPGDAQRNKQLAEIAYLVTSPPIVNEMGQEQSSVPIEIEVDDSEAHIGVLEAFICSAQGQELKQIQPEAYRNLILHLTEHKMLLQQQMQAEMEQQAAMQGNNEKSAPVNAK